MARIGTFLATLICLLGLMGQPADAGFLDSLFGGFVRRLRPPEPPSLPQMSPNALVSPQAPDGGEPLRPHAEGGPRSAYCVRTCDGHYFPVHAQPGMSAAQMCSTFCPASQTRLYAGGGIDYAAANDGSRYRDLPNAYLYRKQLVQGCTCNGKDAFGLARIDINDDPTLARGDIVATKQGLAVVSGRDSSHNVEFTALANSRAISQRERENLAGTRIAGPGRNAPRSPAPETTGAAPAED
jgi:hypothetical protein